MESAEGGDITYLSELTPHPAYGRQALKANF